MNALNTPSPATDDTARLPVGGAFVRLSAAELRSFLELGASQLEAAIKEADGRVNALTQSVTAVAAHSASLERLSRELEESQGEAAVAVRHEVAQVAREMAAATQSAIMSLQFYDKMIQRLTHVRDGLAIPAESVERAPASGSAAWETLLDRVRSRYSMVEERVLFDFLIRGTGPDQMLRALTDLRAASSGGKLDLF